MNSDERLRDMSKSKIMTNEELQELLTRNLRDEDEETIAARKTNYIGAGRLISSIKLDMEAAQSMGRAYFKRTREFLGEDQ